MTVDANYLKDVQEFESFMTDEGANVALEESLPNKDQLCRGFNRATKVIEPLLPFIEKIPVYGGTVAKAVRLLISLGKAVCN